MVQPTVGANIVQQFGGVFGIGSIWISCGPGRQEKVDIVESSLDSSRQRMDFLPKGIGLIDKET